MAKTMSPLPSKHSPKSPKRKPHGAKSKHILEVVEKHPGLSTREVGELVDCDHSLVVKVLARYGVEQAENESYKKNRADIFAGVQSRIIKSLTDDDIKKASLLQKVTAAGILYDKERLERGESTENVATFHATVAEIRRMREAKTAHEDGPGETTGKGEKDE